MTRKIGLSMRHLVAYMSFAPLFLGCSKEGEVGPKGPQGEKGEQGSRGEQGEKGEPGDSANVYSYYYAN